MRSSLRLSLLECVPCWDKPRNTCNHKINNRLLNSHFWNNTVICIFQWIFNVCATAIPLYWTAVTGRLAFCGVSFCLCRSFFTLRLNGVSRHKRTLLGVSVLKKKDFFGTRRTWLSRICCNALDFVPRLLPMAKSFGWGYLLDCLRNKSLHPFLTSFHFQPNWNFSQWLRKDLKGRRVTVYEC